MPLADKEAKREYQKKYRETVREEGGERAAKHRAASIKWQRDIMEEGGKRLDHLRKLRAQWAASWRKNNPHQNLIHLARNRAKKLGLPHTITLETLYWPTHCPIRGVELIYGGAGTGRATSRKNFASLDRHRPTEGYTPENTVVLSHEANRLKSDHTVESLERLLRYIKGDT